MNNLSISSSRHHAFHTGLFLLGLTGVLLVAGLIQHALLGGLNAPEKLFFGKEKTILFLGDSHCEYGIDPQVCGAWENIAQSGESVVCSFYKLRKFLHYNPQIKTLVYTCSMHNLNSLSDFVFFDGISQDALFFRYYSLFDQEGLSFSSSRESRLRGFLAYRLYLPLEWDRNTLKTFVAGKSPYMGGFRFYPSRTVGQECVDTIIRLHYYRDGIVQDASVHQIEYLDKICALAQERGIDIVVITTPLFQAYRDQTPPQAAETLRQTMADLEQKYPDFEYIDFSAIFSDSDSGYFYNGDHLSGAGARTFSEMLLRELDDLL